MPDTRTRIVHRTHVHQHTRAVDTYRRINAIPVSRNYRRIEETRVVRCRTLHRHVTLVKRVNRLFGHTRPVGYIVVHEGRVVREYLKARSGRTCLLTNRSKLNIVIRIAAVTPEDGVEDHTAVTHVDTTRTTMTTTIVGHVRTGAVITAHRSMVHRSAFGEIDTSTFGIRRIIIDYARGRVRRVMTGDRIRSAKYRHFHTLRPWVFIVDMADHQTTTAAGCTAGDLAMTDRTFLIDTYTATVTFYHAHTGRLTGMDIAELDITTAVTIDTAASQRSITALYDTSAHRAVAYHIYTATIRRMLTERGVSARSITGRDHTSVQRCRMLQGLIVILERIVRGIVFTVRGEPYYVERAGRIGGVISTTDGIEGERNNRTGVVSSQDGLVLQIPLRSDLRAGSGTDTRWVRPVLFAGLVVRHDTQTRAGLRRRGIKTTIDMDTGVDLKGGVKHRTTARLRRLRRQIRTGCNIHRTGRQVVGQHIFVQVVNRILHAVLSRFPTTSVIAISTIRMDIANRIRLRVRHRAHAHGH